MRKLLVRYWALAIFLALGLGLPPPALALRVQAGLESNSESRLGSALSGTAAAGLENALLEELRARWAVGITLVGRPPMDPLTKQLLKLAEAVHADVRRLYPGGTAESRIAKMARGDAVLLIEADRAQISRWEGEEEALWGSDAHWEWPWIEERLRPSRRKILLQWAEPLQRIPLFRQVYESLQQQLLFPAQSLTQREPDALETAAFYIAKGGPETWDSAQGVIATYKKEVAGLDLGDREERLQLLIATSSKEAVAPPAAAGQEEGSLARVQAMWRNLRAASPVPSVVIIGDPAAGQFRGALELLRGLERSFYLDPGTPDERAEMLVEIYNSGSSSALFYGGLEGARVLQTMAEGFIEIVHRPHREGEFLIQLKEILAAAGMEEGAIESALEEFAAGLEQLAPAA